MPSKPMTCPRCGNPKAKPNSRTTLHCRKCGGTVPQIDQDDGSDYYGNDPLQNLIDRENGVEEAGRVMPDRVGTLRGGRG